MELMKKFEENFFDEYCELDKYTDKMVQIIEQEYEEIINKYEFPIQFIYSYLLMIAYESPIRILDVENECEEFPFEKYQTSQINMVDAFSKFYQLNNTN